MVQWAGTLFSHMEGNCITNPDGMTGDAADGDVELVKGHCCCRLFEGVGCHLEAFGW
jgi:hypothetical protein